MTEPLPVTLDDVRAAARRIAPFTRRTPSLPWTCRGAGHELDGRRVTFKLEHLQVGGSFKARGAVNKLVATPPGDLRRGVATASGGNHGIGVAWAASSLGVPATVYLPETAPRSTERRLRAMGADTVRQGAAWDDAWALAVREATRRGLQLVHPFEDPLVIAGQGTVGLELAQDAPDLDAVVVAIGGGGLIAGAALALKALRPGLRVIGVEPEGATSMKRSLEEGRVVALPEVHTIAGTLAPRAIGPLTLAFARALVDEVVLVSDEEMRRAQRLLWDELRLLVEPAGAAALAALTSASDRNTISRCAPLAAAQHVGVLLCGANLDVEALLPSVSGD